MPKHDYKRFKASWNFSTMEFQNYIKSLADYKIGQLKGSSLVYKHCIQESKFVRFLHDTQELFRKSSFDGGNAELIKKDQNYTMRFYGDWKEDEKTLVLESLEYLIKCRKDRDKINELKLQILIFTTLIKFKSKFNLI